MAGFFPLSDASPKGFTGVVELLLQAGASVDQQTKVGIATVIANNYTSETSALLVEEKLCHMNNVPVINQTS